MKTFFGVVWNFDNTVFQENKSFEIQKKKSTFDQTFFFEIVPLNDLKFNQGVFLNKVTWLSISKKKIRKKDQRRSYASCVVLPVENRKKIIIFL